VTDHSDSITPSKMIELFNGLAICCLTFDETSFSRCWKHSMKMTRRKRSQKQYINQPRLKNEGCT